ncbi:nitronate monooxygenase [Zophobihabitans entericus]|uniref:Enoyl-[acyl-carrier-protein] reductase FabK n=1 Tax=Zophobihabitans entericus TaxID=1635327 RepID=A0A6G9I8M0_9GAMM|nr:nitronate monooxygenase [Zophobihabitans entericus]QIQ20563.1 enoyl-[acyl-carrier-protein] reductase FabK [Zophobihabitans entericus]
MSITKLLNIKYPIFQGAMAQISKHQLAAAVSNAGGLGIIASGGMSVEQLRDEVRQCKAKTDKPFAVNLMLMMHNIPELIDVLIEEGVKVVTTGAGTPKPYMPIFKQHGIKVIPVVPNVSIAKKMEELGADALVCEGSEAGGHIGDISTMALVPQVTQAVKIPVLAAGGIGDGRGIAAAYALGAQGIQAGTMFLVAEECPVPDNFKQFVIAANDTATAVTGRKGGAPVRSIKNKMIETYIRLENENASRDELEALTMGSARKAAAGDMENGSIMAGQICGILTQVKPAKQIIEEAFAQAKQIAATLSNRFDF